jgi:hypothetical protein
VWGGPGKHLHSTYLSVCRWRLCPWLCTDTVVAVLLHELFFIHRFYSQKVRVCFESLILLGDRQRKTYRVRSVCCTILLAAANTSIPLSV